MVNDMDASRVWLMVIAFMGASVALLSTMDWLLG